MNGPEGFLPKNQNFMTQVARIPWYRPLRSRHKRVDVIMDIIQFYFASFYLSSKFDNSLRKFETFQCKKAAVNLHCKLLY